MSEVARLRLTITPTGQGIVTVIQDIGGTEVESLLEVGYAELQVSGGSSVVTMKILAQHVELRTLPPPREDVVEGRTEDQLRAH